MTARSMMAPGVARVLDALILVLLLLAINVYFLGGFRETVPWGRVSVTSWWRPALVAALLLVARHAVWRRPSSFQQYALWARSALEARGVRAVLPIAIGSRVAVLVVGFLAVVLFGYRADVDLPWRFHENEFLNLPARWDAGWYIGIAATGYEWDPARAMRQQNIAFFPLYPMLMKYGSLLLGRNLLWTGVAISWAAFLAALVYLYRFADERFGSDRALAAAALLASYPFALFYGAVYTEALFLLAIVAACYHFERGELLRAALWGLAAGLLRPNGALLSVPLAAMAIAPLWADSPAGHGRLPVRAMAARLAVAAMPGIGMLVFSAYIYALTGNPLQWVAQNAAWGRVYRGIDALLEQPAHIVGEHGLYVYAHTQTLELLQLAAVAFVAAAAWPVARRLGMAYALLIVVTIVPPLLMGGFLSMGRVTSVLFPVFVWLGAAVPASHRAAWICVFAMLQAVNAALFFTWRPLF